MINVNKILQSSNDYVKLAISNMPIIKRSTKEQLDTILKTLQGISKIHWYLDKHDINHTSLGYVRGKEYGYDIYVCTCGMYSCRHSITGETNTIWGLCGSTDYVYNISQLINKKNDIALSVAFLNHIYIVSDLQFEYESYMKDNS